MLAARKRPAPATAETVHMPAPVGGLNAISSAAGMPATDAILLWNLLPAEYGLRSRFGYREWVTGILDASGAEGLVRSVLPYAAATAGNSKLFVTTNAGIWDVTDTAQLATEDWQASTEYEVGDRVLNDSDKTYVCVTAGTSDSAGGPTGTGSGIADNDVEWDYVTGARLVQSFGTTTGNAGYGESVVFVSNTDGGHILVYCDEVNGLYYYRSGAWEKPAMGGGAGQIANVDPANFVFPIVYKGRLWFVERDDGSAWYLAADTIYGAATEFKFGNYFRAGGHLVGLFQHTGDGGAGIDDLLVAVSSGGDIVIYQVTDPSSPTGIFQKGIWYAGGLPTGRKVATRHGGDLLVLTKNGILPISRLTIGQSIDDGQQYASYKISNLFNQLMYGKASIRGWSMSVHPEENALVVTYPTNTEQATEQLVMTLTGKAWTRYSDLPIYSAAPHDGKFYFGTTDGRVCINDGYTDNVLLSDPNTYSDITFSLITAFQSLGNGRQKQVQLVRPLWLCDGGAVRFKLEGRYNFDLTQASAPDAGSVGGSVWDTGIWDTAQWSGEYSPQNAVRGVAGMGTHFAVAIKGKARARTVLTGMDITFTQGGVL